MPIKLTWTMHPPSSSIVLNNHKLDTMPLRLHAKTICTDNGSSIPRLLNAFHQEVQSGEATILYKRDSLIIAVGAILTYHGDDPDRLTQYLVSNLEPESTDHLCDVKIFGLLPFDPTSNGSIFKLPRFTISANAESIKILSVGLSDSQKEQHINEALYKLENYQDLAAANVKIRNEQTLQFTQENSTWIKAAEIAIAAISAGEFEKIVLSRRAIVNTKSQISRTAALDELTRLYPGAMSFSTLNLLGASPELLIKRSSHHVQSHPLAGTAPKEDELLLINSEKDNHEHRLVTSFISKQLEQYCDDIEMAEKPTITTFGPICHLGTKIEGRLLKDNPASSLELLRAIHPTPAVSGVPQRQAIDFIQKYEDEPRHFYAGAIGYQSLDGDGEWYLIIRTVALFANSIEFQAGVGLVASSNSESEITELEAKIRSMLPIVNMTY